MDIAKLTKIIDPQAGIVEETYFNKQPSSMSLSEGLGRMSLKEAASTSEFPQLLRQGVKSILFSEYAALPNTSEGWLKLENSNKPDEVWMEGSTLGRAPKVPQGTPYPRADLSVDRSVQIFNDKYGYIIDVTREMILFDQSNLIRQQTEDVAASIRYGEELDAYTALTTSGNYTRTSAAGDNDIGANTATATFSASALITAFETLTTMKDNKSGRYYGVMPDLLVVGPGIELAAMQLLLSDQIQRVTGAATAPTNQNIYGTGTTNPFRGVVTSILKTPFLGRYEWVLLQSRKPVVKQTVWELELTQQTSKDSEGYFNADILSYKASKMYGVGMLNDRFAYFSDSTTAPTVD